MTTYLKFWGTRGSLPVSGKEYKHFGGNSSCLEIRDGKQVVIIDAGTGIRPLQNVGEKIDLFIGHSHIDHISGFPFFRPIYNPKANVTVWSGPGKHSAKELFTKEDAKAIFPGLVSTKAKVTFKEFYFLQTITCGSIQLTPITACHPGLTFGFKIQVGDTTFGYFTDNEVFKGFQGAKLPEELLMGEKNLINILKDSDFLIHEAQYTPEEYKKKVGWGHSSVANVSLLVREIGVKKWYVTHHDPSHTDAFLRKKHKLHQKLCSKECKVLMAYDGLVVKL